MQRLGQKAEIELNINSVTTRNERKNHERTSEIEVRNRGVRGPAESGELAERLAQPTQPRVAPEDGCLVASG